MQHNVSIRNIFVLTNELAGDRFKSKATGVADIQRIVPLWPHELADRSLAGRKKLIAVLDRALRKERRNGQAGHPAYDLARHALLSRVLKQERAELAGLRPGVRQAVGS